MHVSDRRGGPPACRPGYEAAQREAGGKVGQEVRTSQLAATLHFQRAGLQGDVHRGQHVPG